MKTKQTALVILAAIAVAIPKVAAAEYMNKLTFECDQQSGFSSSRHFILNESSFSHRDRQLAAMEMQKKQDESEIQDVYYTIPKTFTCGPVPEDIYDGYKKLTISISRPEKISAAKCGGEFIKPTQYIVKSDQHEIINIINARCPKDGNFMEFIFHRFGMYGIQICDLSSSSADCQNTTLSELLKKPLVKNLK